MATEKQYIINESTLVNIADSIREKEGSTDKITPSQAKDKIANLHSQWKKFTITPSQKTSVLQVNINTTSLPTVLHIIATNKTQEEILNDANFAGTIIYYTYINMGSIIHSSGYRKSANASSTTGGLTTIDATMENEILTLTAPSSYKWDSNLTYDLYITDIPTYAE